MSTVIIIGSGQEEGGSIYEQRGLAVIGRSREADGWIPVRVLTQQTSEDPLAGDTPAPRSFVPRLVYRKDLIRS
jgi:hypothetical protein